MNVNNLLVFRHFYLQFFKLLFAWIGFKQYFSQRLPSVSAVKLNRWNRIIDINPEILYIIGWLISYYIAQLMIWCFVFYWVLKMSCSNRSFNDMFYGWYFFRLRFRLFNMDPWRLLFLLLWLRSLWVRNLAILFLKVLLKNNSETD